jgi:hypothetical protein
MRNSNLECKFVVSGHAPFELGNRSFSHFCIKFSDEEAFHTSEIVTRHKTGAVVSIQRIVRHESNNSKLNCGMHS